MALKALLATVQLDPANSHAQTIDTDVRIRLTHPLTHPLSGRALAAQDNGPPIGHEDLAAEAGEVPLCGWVRRSCARLAAAMLVHLVLAAAPAHAQSLDGNIRSAPLLVQSTGMDGVSSASPALTPFRTQVTQAIWEPGVGMGIPTWEETNWYSGPGRFPQTLDLVSGASWTSGVLASADLDFTGAFHMAPRYVPGGEKGVSTGLAAVLELTLPPQSAITASIPVYVEFTADMPAYSRYSAQAQWYLALSDEVNRDYDVLFVQTTRGEHVAQGETLSVAWENPSDVPMALTLTLWGQTGASAYVGLPPPPPVPEPAQLPLLLAGLSAVIAALLRRRAPNSERPRAPARTGRVGQALAAVLLSCGAAAAQAQTVDLVARIAPPSVTLSDPSTGAPIGTLAGSWASVELMQGYCGFPEPCTNGTARWISGVHTPFTQYHRFAGSEVEATLAAADAPVDARLHFALEDADQGPHGMSQLLRATLQFVIPRSEAMVHVPISIDFDPQLTEGASYLGHVELSMWAWSNSSGTISGGESFSYTGSGPAHFDREIDLLRGSGDPDTVLYVEVWAGADLTQIYAPVPEPSRLATLCVGFAIVHAARRRRVGRSAA